jgi:hypothetical protein
MKQSTLEAIQKAKDDNLIVEFCSAGSARSNKAKNKGAETIIGIWVSRYDPQLRDALIDLYPPHEALFVETDRRADGCFLFVNTATQSIVSMHVGLYNRVQYLLLTHEVNPIVRGSKEWKKFTKVDKSKTLDSFADDLEEFGKNCQRSNELPALSDNIGIMLNENPDKMLFVEYGVSYTREEMELARVEADYVEHCCVAMLKEIQSVFPTVEWADLNNQDGW